MPAPTGVLSPVVAQVPRVGRRARRPQHTFQLRTEPYAITPFFTAPVLPGDTLKNLLMQSRVVTDPIKNPLLGWWKEYYFFYVPHRALNQSPNYGTVTSDLEAIMLDPTATMNSSWNRTTTHSTSFYEYIGGVIFNEILYEAVVRRYFRAEDEALTAGALIGNYYAASYNKDSWLQSAMTQTQYDALYPGVDPVVADSADAGTDLNASEVEAALRMWEISKQLGLTQATYEDVIRMYGVAIPDRVNEQPDIELIRYTREWSYPANTVEPTTGVPTSAVSWAISERADKDRFFREPGFLFGVTVARPKLYFSEQKGSAVGMMNDMYAWAMPLLGNDVQSRLKKFAAAAGPIPNQAAAYWVDVMDLYLHGDQFINFALTETNAGLVALPESDLDKRFPTQADVRALFTGGAAYYVKEDGVVSLNILSRIGRDITGETYKGVA